MARQSRPPGFDMTYRPREPVSFGPPLGERAPSIAYLALALAVCAVVVYGQNAPSSSRFFYYVVELDRQRILPASSCAIILLVSALAAVLRTQMRGVVVHPDGVEMRELLSLGWPRVRRFAWSQIDRVVVPPPHPERRTLGTLSLDLWDGSRAFLPRVDKQIDLAIILERVALARAIPLEGGTGMIDDLANPLGDADDAEDPGE